MPSRRAQRDAYSADFLFAHRLINELSVIVGHADLLNEELEKTDLKQHVDAIKATASNMTDELRKYQHKLKDLKQAG